MNAFYKVNGFIETVFDFFFFKKGFCFVFKSNEALSEEAARAVSTGQ